MEYYAGVLIGAVLYLLLQLNNIFKDKDFDWDVWLRTNIVPTVLNVIIGCLCVWQKDELVNIYPITVISAVMLGVGGQSIFKKVQSIFDPNINSIIST